MTHEKLKSLASMLAQDTLIDPAQVCVHQCGLLMMKDSILVFLACLSPEG